MTFAERKKDIVDKITGILIEEMEKETVSEEDGKVIATYILSKKENLTTNEELVEFLQTLSQIWPIFLDLYETESKVVTEEHNDAEKIDQIKQQLSTLANMSA